MPANLRIAGFKDARMSGERTCEPLVPGQLVREAVGIVEKIHDSFLKSIGAELSELLQTPAMASFRESVQTPFSGALNLSGNAGDAGSVDYTIALDLSPMRGCGYLVFPPTLLFGVLDILLATPERSFAENTADDNETRTVTAIELDILAEFFEVFAGSLRDAWKPFYPVAFNRTSMPPEQAGSGATAMGSDLALTLRATIDLAGVSADFNLVVPAYLARLVHLKSRAAMGRDTLAEPVRPGILDCLGGATVRMEAVLGGASIRIRDLLDLVPGQILTVGNSEGSSFDCLVNGNRLFAGELVASGGRCAIQIDTLRSFEDQVGSGARPKTAS